VQDKFFNQQEFTSETLLQELVPTLYISNNDVPEMFSYGNYILAGLIVEKVSGMNYADYLNQYVIAPADLQHTSYCLPQPAKLARGYYLPENGFEPLQVNTSAVFAAGGICSTAGDLLLWMDALTSGKVVSPESYQLMITPAQFPDGSSSFFGYGLYVLPNPNGLQIGSLGFEASYVSFLISYPEKGLTIALLSNTAKPDNNLFESIQSNIPILMP
jgi:CubicO group peptidase (beta-lactamase class C family)